MLDRSDCVGNGGGFIRPDIVPCVARMVRELHSAGRMHTEAPPREPLMEPRPYFAPLDRDLRRNLEVVEDDDKVHPSMKPNEVGLELRKPGDHVGRRFDAPVRRRNDNVGDRIVPKLSTIRRGLALDHRTSLASEGSPLVRTAVFEGT